MPNWVLTHARFTGNQTEIDKMRKFMKSKDSVFDFNRLIPMPKALDIESGSSEDIAKACARARKNGQTTCSEYSSRPWAQDQKTFNEWADMGDIYESNFKRYGCSTWYDWNCMHWGTKWNASDPAWSPDSRSLSFETAWSFAEPIFNKLAKKFPTVEMYVEFADEDIGHNCGTWDSDSCQANYIDDVEFACNVWGYDYKEYIGEREEC